MAVEVAMLMVVVLVLLVNFNKVGHNGTNPYSAYLYLDFVLNAGKLVLFPSLLMVSRLHRTLQLHKNLSDNKINHTSSPKLTCVPCANIENENGLRFWSYKL